MIRVQGLDKVGIEQRRFWTILFSALFVLLLPVFMFVDAQWGIPAERVELSLAFYMLAAIQAYGIGRYGGVWASLVYFTGLVLFCAFLYLSNLATPANAAVSDVAIDFMAAMAYLPIGVVFRSYGFEPERPGDRDTLRIVLIGGIAASLLFSACLFVELVRLYASETLFFSWVLPALLLLGMHLLGSAWLYSCTITASDPFFFQNVCVSQSGKDDGMAMNNEELALFALLKPAEVFRRIRESISPGIGCFHVKTEYEFNPGVLPESAGSAMIPLALFGKEELSNELHISASGGCEVYRATEWEARRTLALSLGSVLRNRGESDEATAMRQGAEIIDLAFGSKTAAAGSWFDEKYSSYIKRQGFSKWGQSLVSNVFDSLRNVKPTVMMVAVGDGWDIPLTLTVERDVSLVPIRNDAVRGVAQWGIAIRRLFTKRRMRYYFNLGNADCCETYHLTFEGPEGTYLTRMELKGIDSDSEVFIAEEMKAMNRYDQQKSRLYVRGGHGFSRCALAVGYEERGHKPIVALSITSLLCLLVMFAMGFMYVFSQPDVEVSLRDLVIPVSVLGLGGSLSLWEAMESYRAEEWLWLGASTSVVLCFVAATHLIWLYLPGQGSPDEIARFVWIAYMTVEFAIMEASTMALFERVKQHGALIDRVPYTRVAPLLGNLDREEAEERIDEIESNAMRTLGDVYIQDLTSQSQGVKKMRSDSKARYSASRRYILEQDMIAYDMLRNRGWDDGWLVPSWSAALNPRKAPYKPYTSYLLNVIEAERSSLDG